MPCINPSPADLAEFARCMPANTPILMLNLLRLNEQAAYRADSEQPPCSGREAYVRYSLARHWPRCAESAARCN